MTEFSCGSDVYTTERLKQKLQDRYEDFVFFAEFERRRNVVCFHNIYGKILNKWEMVLGKNDINDEAHRIVTITAKIIMFEIREKIRFKAMPNEELDTAPPTDTFNAYCSVETLTE